MELCHIGSWLQLQFTNFGVWDSELIESLFLVLLLWGFVECEWNSPCNGFSITQAVHVAFDIAFATLVYL